MNETDYMKMVTDKEAEFSSLFSRMDKDKGLAVSKEYRMFDKDDQLAPDVDNVTINDSQVFWKRVTSTLIGANMQTVVEGEKLEDKETTFIEDFIRDMELAVDERLQKREIPSLRAFNVHQMCGRGRVGTRVYLHMKDGNFIPDVLPIDTRYLIYDVGVDGLKWVAPRFNRTKEEIEEEYKVTPPFSTGTLTDRWDSKFERIFAENNEIKVKPNKYKYPPFVIQLAPTGLLFQDADRRLYEGESIFAPNRNLYEAKDKLGSILMTMGVLSFYGGLQYESEAGAGAQKPKLPPYGKRFVVPVDKGTKGFFSMPIQDVTNALRWLYKMLEDALQKGSLPAVSYGSLTFPLSAVAITALTEAEDPVYLPEMQGLALYYQRLYRMIINQYIQGKMKVKLGEPGFQKEYPYMELDKDYSIKFKFFATSPKQNIANYSIAAAAREFVSEDTIRRDILRLENPDAELTKKVSELADKMVPTLALYKMARAKLDQEEEIEAQLIASQLGLTLEQLKSGKLLEKPIEGEKARKPMIPLLAGEGGRQSSAKEAAELEVEQEAEE